MEGISKLKPKLDDATVCHENLSPKIRIINFPVKPKPRKLNCGRTTTNNGNFRICHKLNTLISFIFIILLFVTLGLTAYTVLKQEVDSETQSLGLHDEFLPQQIPNALDESNSKYFIDVSQPTKEVRESEQNYLLYRVRRSMERTPSEKGVIYKRQTNNIKRRMEKVKKITCKERYDYCQNIFASMHDDINDVDKVMKNLQTSADSMNDKHLTDYMKCLQCRAFEQHNADKHNQLNGTNSNRMFETDNHNEPNNAGKIVNSEVIDSASNFYSVKDDRPSQNNPMGNHIQIPEVILEEDILTGPDFLNEMSTRDNRDTLGGKVPAQTLNNGTTVDGESSDARTSHTNYIRQRILSGRPYGQSEHTIGTRPQILPTAETVKTGQQLQLTPPILQYPLCFYGVPPVVYPQAKQQLPIIYPSGLPYEHLVPSSSGIHPSAYNPSQIPSNNFATGEGQGFVSFESSNYQLPYPQQFGNPPQLPLGPTSPTRYDAQGIGPTGPGRMFGDTTYPVPMYCTFMPTFQFPIVPGDYQRSSGPAYDFENKETYDPEYVANVLRSGADVNEPSDIVSPSQGGMMQSNSSQCKTNYRQCLDNSLCISRTQWCDGKVDCADASDEVRCSCKDRITKSRLCDGYFDCPHGEDELGCFSCPSNAFNCEDWNKRNPKGNCLTLSERCDGIKQCRNGKDEKDCSALMDEDVDDDDIFSVGYASGYLYQNYRGKWYPACTPTKIWAMESCAGETGSATFNQESPNILRVPATQNKGPFISKLTSGQLALVPDCNNQTIFVTCPQIPCGTRIIDDGDRFRSVARFEDILVASPHLNLSEHDNDGARQLTESEEMEDILSQQEESSMDSRIVGGRASQPKAWPSIVAIYKDGLYKCGGVILDENWILTAAHCLEKHYTHYYRVAAGLLRRFSFSPMEQSRRAEYVIIHPEYYSPLKINDLGLIRLNEPLRFNRWIRPICLPDVSLTPRPGELCTTIGWGSTVEHGPEPDHLREVQVPVLPSCKMPSDKTAAVICAGKVQGGKDACQGDSGGPMMCRVSENSEQWYVGGIVSHGIGCARPHEPGAYTNVSNFSPWITEIIRDKRSLVGPKPLEKCPGFSCDGGLGKCLPKNRRCDKNVDCIDAEDEINCPQGIVVDQPSFRSNSDNISEDFSEDNYQTEPNRIFEGIETLTKKSIVELGNVPISVATVSTTNSISTTTDPENVLVILSPTMSDNISTITEPSSMSDDFETPHWFELPPSFTCTRLVQSISMNARCNKVIDCEDGTDEVNCTCKDILRNVYPAAICNGRVDCYDLTDEENCGFCKEDEFICIRSGTCIPLNKKCDNKVDCPLGEDELDCLALIWRPTIDADNRLADETIAFGKIIKQVNGTWRTYCSDDPGGDTNQHVVDQVCQYLGFKGMSWIDAVEKSNLTLVNNKDLDETDSEFVVWGTDSGFKLLEGTEGDECQPILTKCKESVIAPSDSFFYWNTTEPNGSYMWPWQGALLVEGKYHCPATLLNKEWFITSRRCTENIDLNINATTLLVGLSPAYKYVPGPYEETRNVTIIKPIDEFNVSLLKVDPYILSRYILPIFDGQRFRAATEHDECFAVGTDPKFKSTTTRLQSVPDSCSSCERCYQREIHDDECKNGTHKDWSGIVTCRGPGGWYPAAAFDNEDIICGFQTTRLLASIENMVSHLTDTMDGWDSSQLDLPYCDGVRCERGKCIPWQKVCDGIQDCERGEDESTPNYCDTKRNLCQNSSSILCECSKSELKCRSGECVPKQMYCDGKSDCADGSDEPIECNCAEYLKLTAPERICDDIRHCYDKSDENQCNCTEKSYRCVNSNESDECIPYDFICDGDKDCVNGEDEAVCRMIKNNPNSSDFAGEVLHRNYGIWHTECFPAPIQNDSQAQEICQSFGHSDGKVVTFEEAAPYGPATDLELENFFMIRLSDTWAITTREDKPLARVVQAADECHRAFIKCL